MPPSATATQTATPWILPFLCLVPILSPSAFLCLLPLFCPSPFLLPSTSPTISPAKSTAGLLPPLVDAWLLLAAPVTPLSADLAVVARILLSVVFFDSSHLSGNLIRWKHNSLVWRLLPQSVHCECSNDFRPRSVLHSRLLPLDTPRVARPVPIPSDLTIIAPTRRASCWIVAYASSREGDAPLS